MPLYHNQKAEDEADVARVQFADSPDVLGAMDSFYGVDLKNRVNIHNDEEGDAKAKENGVDAVASGNDIYFGKGAYDMSNRDSRGLLAHEAAHVIQQGGLNGMNMNSPFGIAQGGFLDKVGKFFSTVGHGLGIAGAAVAGGLTGLVTRIPKFGKHKKKKIANVEELIEMEDIKKPQLTNASISANPVKLNNGWVKLEDGGYTNYGDTSAGSSSGGVFGKFERAMTAPDLVTHYDYRDSEDWQDTARAAFNNAQEYVGTLKHRLLSSTLTGSIIYAFTNWNFHYLRRAWPVRIITGAIRWAGTFLTGIGQGIRWLYGHFKRDKRHKAEAAHWWEQNAGPFFLPFVGRKVHRFFSWIRSKARGRGDVKKSGLLYDMADEDFEDTVKINGNPNFLVGGNDSFSEPEMYGNLMDISGMDLADGQGGIKEDIDEAMTAKGRQAAPGPITMPQTNDSSNEMQETDIKEPTQQDEEALEEMQAINEITEDDLKDMPDELKVELIKNSGINPMAELNDKEKDEMVGDILSDPKAGELIEPVLTEEDKEKINNTEPEDLAPQENEATSVPEETLAMPMMPLNRGAGVNSIGGGPVTYRNSEDAIDDGWASRPETFEKTRDAFEQVGLFAEVYGGAVYEKFRRIQISAENRQDDVLSKELYEECLETMMQLSESSEENRNAKIWGMRYLRSVNNFKKSQVA